MKKIVEVRGVRIGEDMPKICVSLIGKNDTELIEEMASIKTLPIDVVEWRMDYHTECEDINSMLETLKKIRQALGDKPLLATFRSKNEGGEKVILPGQYVVLNKRIIESKLVDLIDIELFTGDELVKEMVQLAHSYDIKVVISNHDFTKTPTKEEIIRRLCKMQAMEADLPKIAVMPQNAADVLTLLAATNEMVTDYADRPIITMSMGGLGVVSRLAGETFGSALTFGAVKTASAPGQIEVIRLREALLMMHQSKA